MSSDKMLRSVAIRIAVILILNTVLLLSLTTVTQLIGEVLKEIQPFSFLGYARSSDITYALTETLGMAAYLFSFMFPVAVFGWLLPREKRERMRLGVTLGKDIPLTIIAAIGLILSFSFLNSILVDFIDFSSIMESNAVDSPAKLILQFMSVALVPAFCEEFLFRGCVLSNLLPFGKTTAIIGSAVLFSLMHGNPAQYLYTAAAGIILGFVYVQTGSVWPGTLIHLFNNFFSILLSVPDSVWGENSDIAAAVILIMETAAVAGGLICAVILIIRGAGAKKADGAIPSRSLAVEPRLAFRAFMNPATIVFIVLSLSESALVLLATMIA